MARSIAVHSLTDCPVAKATAIVGDAYTLLIVRDLLAGPRRFCELETSIEGISTRTLSAKLKKLETDGIIKHAAARSAYALTPKGRALAGVTEALRRFGKRYL
ncbi:helix-turn-helix transcriptional regulator [Candidatus Kaiserbacteria bacterium]|nr:helix-turn-helix transcriptional regulator [Candidatus Kaiserbacteria bacterium]